MSNIIPFVFESKQVRAVRSEGGEPWFVAADVASALGYLTAKDMTRFLDDDEKDGQIMPTPGGPQEMTIISESGLYHAVLKSRKPEAKRFKRWVTGDVLPTIRKTGSYLAPGATLESLPPAIARQVGGIIKAVVHKEVSEALTLALPSLIHGELAKQRTGIRHGVTAGQIWHDHGLPTKGLRGFPSWFGNRLAGRGRARRQHVAVVLGDYARAGDLRASSSIAFAIGSISCTTCLTW
jgi:prophage antirepressor-like protein